MRITKQLLAQADDLERRGHPHPYRRVTSVCESARKKWEAEHNLPMPDDFVHEMVATKIEPPWQWLEWADIFRPAMPGEFATLRYYSGRVVIVAQEPPPPPPEGRPRIIPVRMAPLESHLKQVLERITETSTQAAETAVCGAPTGSPEAQPCTDEQEDACRWFACLPDEGASLVQRTKLRPEACPRRKAQEAIRKGSAELEALQRKAHSMFIPERFIRELVLSAKQREDRPCMVAVREWAPCPKRYMALCADNQEGKSYSASAWLLTRPDGVFIECGALHDAIRPGQIDAPEKLARMAARRARYVVIDNIESHLTKALRAEIDEIFVRVGNRDGRVLITTSMSADELLEALAEPGANNGAALSRLRMYGRIVDLSRGATQ